MFLSGKAIQQAVLDGDFTIAPFNASNLKGASYGFTLSQRLRIPGGLGEDYKEVEIPADGFILEPGAFVLGFTREKLSLNGKYVCFLSTRPTCAQMGLSVLLGSCLAEPDTDNVQTLEIHNASSFPIKMESGMKIVKGAFALVGEPENS